MNASRGIINALGLSAVFWALVSAGILFVYDSEPAAEAKPVPEPTQCTCANKPDNCQHVSIDVFEGRTARGVMWTEGSGEGRHCLRMRNDTGDEIEIDG